MSVIIKAYTLRNVPYIPDRTACFGLHYDVQCFLFFWSLGVSYTGFTLGEYFVRVNISLIAPPETWDVCFQVLCLHMLYVYLSVSVVTLALRVLTLAAFRFISHS